MQNKNVATKLGMALASEKDKPLVEKIVNSNIVISREDWDSFETSWDFKKHPLI